MRRSILERAAWTEPSMENSRRLRVSRVCLVEWSRVWSLWWRAWDLERRSCSREEKWEERSFQRRVQVVRREDCFSMSSKVDWIGSFGG